MVKLRVVIFFMGDSLSLNFMCRRFGTLFFTYEDVTNRGFRNDGS